MPVSLLQQDQPPAAPASLEITGVNAVSAPDVTITVDVTDVAGQTVRGLDVENFQLGGPLASVSEIVRVESTEDNLPFAVVLVIDTSSSMSGTPMQRTQAAARAFVESLGPEDPVALVTFDNDPRVLREFTTDKADLLAAIDSLAPGGQTALYDGAVTGIEVAARAPYPRRAVILLSDGAEYGGASQAAREIARDLSPVRGVPVYTIGLGFGTDRTYLQELADASSARFFESPTPEELSGVYDQLAALFRTQYILTLNFTGDLNGQIYPLTLRAVNPAGESRVDAATLRAPIPVPIVGVSPEPTAALASPVTFTAAVRADQAVAQVEFTFGAVSSVDTEAPFTFEFDPFTAAPGDYTLTARATDADGDTGEVSLGLTVAPIASRLTLDTDFAALGPIAQPVTVSVTADSQTPPQAVEFRVDGQSLSSAAELPASFTLDPFTLSPGPHTVEFVVTDQSGTQAAVTQTADIAPLPPQISVDTGALPAGELLEAATVRVSAAGQTPIASIAFTAAGFTQVVEGAETSEFTFDPIDFAPGPQNIVVIVTDEAGTSAAARIPFTAGVLPAVVAVEGLADDDVLDGPRVVTVTVGGQTSEADVTLVVDSVVIDTEETAPYEFAIDPRVLFDQPGTHLISFDTVNAFGAADRRDIRVTVPESVFPTPTPTPTATPDASQTAAAEAFIAQTTADAVATADAGATAQAQSTAAFQATGEAVATQAIATANAVSTQAAAEREAALSLATADAQSTQDTAATLAARDAQATQEAATLDAQASLDAASAATAQAAATLDADATAAADQTVQAQASLDAQATAAAQQTEQAQSTNDVAATEAARQTGTARADAAGQRLLTAEARATLETQGTIDVQLTHFTQQTADAQATRDARSTLDVAAVMTAQAAVTEISLTAAAINAVQTDVARETADAEASATAQAALTQAAAAAQTTREFAQSIATEQAATVVAQVGATEDAQATETAAVAPTATPTVEPSATPEPPTAEPTTETPPTDEPTDEPTGEPTAGATELQPTPTVFDPTSTPGEPTDIVAEGADAPDSQLALLAVGAGILLLVIILAFIAAARRRNE